MKLLMDIIRAVRNIRAEVNTPMSKKVSLYISAKDAATAEILEKIKHISKSSVIQKHLKLVGLASTMKTMSAVVIRRRVILTACRVN